MECMPHRDLYPYLNVTTQLLVAFAAFQAQSTSTETLCFFKE